MLYNMLQEETHLKLFKYLQLVDYLKENKVYLTSRLFRNLTETLKCRTPDVTVFFYFLFFLLETNAVPAQNMLAAFSRHTHTTHTNNASRYTPLHFLWFLGN